MAIDDTASTSPNTPVDVAVLGNDSDPDGDQIALTGAAGASHGATSIDADIVRYTPESGFVGEDVFAYSIDDGRGGVAGATVRVTVLAVDARPVAVDDRAETAMDTPVTIDVLVNDSDPEGEPLTIVDVSQGGHGQVENHGANLTYTPLGGYAGRDTFTYTVRDTASGTDVASVDVMVTKGQAPVTVDPGPIETSEDVVSEPFTLTGTDAENAEGQLIVTVTTRPAHGELSLVGGTAPLAVVYTPRANRNGSDSFEFSVTDTDQNESWSRRVTLAVSPVNDAPAITGQQDISTVEDTPLAIEVASLEVDDPDNVFPADFTLTVLDGSGYTHAGNTVTPNANLFGALTVGVLVRDGGADSDVFALAVDVAPVNDAPVIGFMSANPTQVSHASAATLTVTASDVDDAVGTLDYAYTVISGQGSIAGSGASVTFNAGSIIETVTVQVVVSDNHGGEDRATLDLPIVNHAPAVTNVTPAPATITDNATSVVTVSATDADGDGLEYSYALGAASTAGGTLSVAEGTFVSANTVTYTPASAGIGVIDVVVRDALGATTAASSATITVQASAPVISVRSCLSCAEIPPLTGSYDFGTVTVGQSKGPTSLYIRNTGTRDLHVSGVALSAGDTGDFDLDSSATAATVAPGSSTTFAIEFAPSTTGSRAATLSVASDDDDRSPYALQLRGSGRNAVDLHVATTGSDTTGNGSTAAPYATVGKAMSIAVAGDRVLVASGTYDLTFPGVDVKAGVSLLGGYSAPAWTRDIAANVTTLRDVSTSGGSYYRADGVSLLADTFANPRTVVRFNGSDIQASTLLEGFTLEASTVGAPYVAAVWVYAGGPVVRSNIIRGGTGNGGSGACAVKAVTLAGRSQARLEGNTIHTGTGGSGGVCGVEVRDSGTNVVIHDNVISGGSTTGSSGGASGIDVSLSGTALVDANTVTNATGPGAMAALNAAFASHVMATNNVFYGVGGGTGTIDLVRLYQSPGEVMGNTIFRPSTVTAQTIGLTMYDAGTVVARNNLFYMAGSSATLRYTSGTVSLTFEYNFCYQNGATQPYFTQDHNVTSTLSTFVQFRDQAGGDLHLTAATPVDIRAGGSDMSAWGVIEDRDAAARTSVYETSSGAPSNGGVGWSIGAYEQDG